MKHKVIQVVLLLLLAATVFAQNTPVFKQQTIETSKGDSFELWEQWEDVNSDGLTDLLILIQNEEKAFTYIQSSRGFPETPTQTITFPKNTMWFTLFDISEHPGKEMLISTSQGLVYYRQNNGIFEIKPEKLIRAKQVFPENHSPIINHLRKSAKNSKHAIPVVFSDHTVIYNCDENYQIKPERKIEHKFERSIEKHDLNGWMIGSKKLSHLHITTKTREKEEEDKEKEPEYENEYLKKAIERIKKDNNFWRYNIEKKDINGDGKKDILLFHIIGDVDCKTNIMVFIRQENGKLPEKPNHVLRCRGFPIDWGNRSFSILNDINNDGVLEIVLAELKSIPLSASSLVEMAVSKGTQFIISIRKFKKTKGYTNKADIKIDVTTLLPLNDHPVDMITFDGDFNADSQKDLIVKRSQTQFDIFLNSPASGNYDKEPSLQLEVPAEGRISLEDLNNDGASDIYFVDNEKGRITVFLSEASKKKGTISESR